MKYPVNLICQFQSGTSTFFIIILAARLY